MVPREKCGNTTDLLFQKKLMKSKVWINNQLSEIQMKIVMIFNQNQSTTQLELNKIDPTNLNGKKSIKTTSTIKIKKKRTKSIPETYLILLMVK
jgi:hypothetical protein